MKSILFVCTGNICRSPTADAVMQDLAQQANVNLHVDSAGTHAYHVGEHPDHRTIDIARAKGVDMTPLRARKIARADFQNFDYLIAMDQGHADIMHQLASPNEADKIKLFMDFVASDQGKDVPDPYYGSIKDFEHVYDLCLEGCQALLAEVID